MAIHSTVPYTGKGAIALNRLVSYYARIGFGTLLLFIGIFIPYAIMPELMTLDSRLHDISHLNGSALMIDAFLVVSINTIVSLPQFVSVVMIGDGIADASGRPAWKALIPLLLVPFAYVVVNLLTPLTYNFGATDMFIWLIIVLMQKFSRLTYNLGMKLLVFCQLIFGVTWLNQVPFLTPYGFGHGSLSLKVKQAAAQIGFDDVLTLYADILFLIFVASALTLWIYLALYMERGSITQELHRAQLEAQKSRSGREVLHLVHDLKTPLAAIQGLVSLIEIRWTDPKLQEYCNTIDASIHSMSNMISEILYEERKDWCDLKELIDYVRASRLSGSQEMVHIEWDESRETTLYINKIRMTRAIVNLLDNALDAVQGKENGRVALRVRPAGKEVLLEVIDNGGGIPPERIRKIWKTGFSTKHHPGVGLVFVRQVVEGHGGAVRVKSEMGQGTKVTITLPIGENR